jgi:imidazolonepropionase-like amidohydrolase
MSEVDHWSHQQFSDEEITAIVEEAARAGRFVAAHAEGKAGIMAALRCGVQTIEHGDDIDDEVVVSCSRRTSSLYRRSGSPAS